jgi:cytochrome P450
LEAVTQEVLRWSRVVPLLGHAAGTPPVTAPTHQASAGDQQYVEFRGFKIPRGTPVYLNLYAVLRDEKVWEHPNKFYPEHFYDPATGSLKNLDKNLAFSLGEIIYFVTIHGVILVSFCVSLILYFRLKACISTLISC